MAVIQRPSTHKFIQQAYREAKYGKSVTKQASDAQSKLYSTHKPDSQAVPYDQSSKRRVAMALVDLCTAYMEGLWPNQSSQLPLRRFVFEILRRSRIQYPVFQVALCYMARLKPVINKYAEQNQPIPEKLACGRRVLVSALQVASKFLQDRCYSATVWARISGLRLEDLKQNELALMEALDWNLFVSSEAYMRSCKRLRVTVDSVFKERIVSPLSPASASPGYPSTSFASPVYNSNIPTPLASPSSVSLPKSPEVEIWHNY